MTPYPFDLVPPEGKKPIAENHFLSDRPFARRDRSLASDAPLFVAGEALADAINTAIAVGEPLLLTGETGTGKTQTAYYMAYQLGVRCFHFQVKSDSTAGDLLYHFDMVRYFRDANLAGNVETLELAKRDYIEPRDFWKAIRAGEESGLPQVVLIDEVDKAPRDFPNDLLYELDQMAFTIRETGEKIEVPARLRPMVVITSNSERRLPEPFLRRCIYHHIDFDEHTVKHAVARRRTDYPHLSDDFIEEAVGRFLDLRERNLRKTPATGELLVWLRILDLTEGKHRRQLSRDLSKLPHLGALIKDHLDLDELKGSGL